MAEEKDPIPTLNSDDVHTLRILLHRIRGINAASSRPVSTTPDEIAE